MIGTPPPIPRHNAINVAVFDGCSGCSDPRNCLPAGHSLSRARLRHFQQAAWIVVTEDSIPVGLAAYKRVDSDVRVVHEFLLDRTLGGRDMTRVTDVLLSAVETMAYDDSVGCLMFLLGGDVVLAPFEQRGYTAVAIDPAGAWMQKKLDRMGWASIRSEHPN